MSYFRSSFWLYSQTWRLNNCDFVLPVKVSDCISKYHFLIWKTTETGEYLAVAPTSYIGLAVCLMLAERGCSSWGEALCLLLDTSSSLNDTRVFLYFFCANGVAVPQILVNPSYLLYFVKFKKYIYIFSLNLQFRWTLIDTFFFKLTSETTDRRFACWCLPRLLCWTADCSWVTWTFIVFPLCCYIRCLVLWPTC